MAAITSKGVRDIVCNAYLIWVQNGTVRAIGGMGRKKKYVPRGR